MRRFRRRCRSAGSSTTNNPRRRTAVWLTANESGPMSAQRSWTMRNRMMIFVNACVLLFCCFAPLLGADTTWITKLGGKVQRDAGGRIVAVNLRGSWVADVDMLELARMPDLQRLDLSH